MHEKELQGVLVEYNDVINISFELPDAIFGFKKCVIEMPNLVIKSREGFSDEEMQWIVSLCKDNRRSIEKIAKDGVIYA
jgi:hypothetical protein